MSDKNPLAHICLKCNATAGNFCQEPDPKSPSGFTKLDPNKFHIERLIASGAHPYNAEKVMTPLDVQCPLCESAHGGETWSAKPSDPINPAHYKGDLVMRIIEHFGLQDDFALGNVIKYILRHKSKAGIEDLKKARWYLDRRIAQLDGSLKGGLS